MDDAIGKPAEYFRGSYGDSCANGKVCDDGRKDSEYRTTASDTLFTPRGSRESTKIINNLLIFLLAMTPTPHPLPVQGRFCRLGFKA